MHSTPNKIYLIDPYDEQGNLLPNTEDVCWCADPVGDVNVAYIREDAAQAELADLRANVADALQTLQLRRDKELLADDKSKHGAIAMTPSPETRRRINAELARAMGYKLESRDARNANGVNLTCWVLLDPEGYEVTSAYADSESTALSFVPDYFTDHKANAELMEWLAGQSQAIQLCFVVTLTVGLYQELEPGCRLGFMDFMASPLPVRVMAACAALGISTEGE